ncbi:SRPBCC family protein [Cognatiyoonia sp. IB215446]|uniref:SRPBCC family protein n=1 Tax=Cognatiyoonia sp. IB215446 TaxID=3097355 RepID=UPI002A0F726F|nr:SRPBCC family protein [Cognatiyoonia sp. IB215446]MDX8346910.1 SRPBCC family protein [Cognatiyoonia sp. IB215446]
MNFKKIATHTACGVAALAVATLALPRHVSIERTAVIDTAPEAVIELAASNTGYQVFNPYKDLDPNLQVEMFGPSSGIGSGFSFQSKDGVGQQTVASVTADQVVFDLDLGPLGQPTQAISAVAIDGATEVTWSMEMDLGMNPVFRVMGLFMDGMLGPNFELGLANIADVAA